MANVESKKTVEIFKIYERIIWVRNLWNGIRRASYEETGM